MAKLKKAPDRESPEWKLTEWVAKFCSAVFGRRLRPSRAVYEEIVSATLDHGFTAAEIKLAFWACRCVRGTWVGQRLEAGDVGPALVLRHRGGINSQTGKPAQRFLDDLLERVEEMNPATVGHVLRTLVPDDMRDDEERLLTNEGIKYE